ncbi:MAG: radical SAM family heme chaperone HemW [Clostridia bacterium]|nr:radical SAM family heme chaperone HemW [Clostridia bacterium]
MAGLYIHIPFCAKKCAYCNFYSACVTETVFESYFQALIKEIRKWGGSLGRPFETVYIGGGTPSLLGERIIPLMWAIRESFNILPNAEITAEMNPDGDYQLFLTAAQKAGVNRISIGAQSGIDSELALLGRTHSSYDTKKAFFAAREAGFKNISLDLMTGLPDSSINSLKTSLDFLGDLNPEHISTYILKIEEKTKLSMCKGLNLPDEDAQAEQYLFTCKYLEEKGYSHYEISNFSKQGFEGRHNLKYWQCEEYLGIGPAAHSFIDGKRFFYPANLKGFINNPHTEADGEGGGCEEYFMLNLRLKKGINLIEFSCKFGITIHSDLYDYLHLLQKEGLIKLKQDTLSLTDEGMLVSNTVITEILERLI